MTPTRIDTTVLERVREIAARTLRTDCEWFVREAAWRTWHGVNDKLMQAGRGHVIQQNGLPPLSEETA